METLATVVLWYLQLLGALTLLAGAVVVYLMLSGRLWIIRDAPCSCRPGNCESPNDCVRKP